MHIGVDLDNTILDATSSHLQYYNQVSGLSLAPEDVNDFYLYRLYGWGKTESDEMYHRYGHEIHLNSNPLENAIEVLQTFFDRHIISIITARPLLFRDVTIEWLKLHKINYHNIVFTEEKLQECINLKIDVLIDDGPHYAAEFSLVNKPVILYEQPYNLSVNNDFVYRAKNWLEVKNKIDFLELKVSL
ncbi:putative HAD superfamily protein [Paenibacillus sp. DS2015]|uniref:5' nucleotidase, NT5C type n=1 Tax=Paenibacillus sp. DS2015 TaxID=3373917 RepID=UPI003D216079